MADLFLIAHRVRGLPAFDVAIQMECPHCNGMAECHECDFLGYWWIIPTSGHRAYPWWHTSLLELACENPDVNDQRDWPSLHDAIPPMPPSLPDHYPSRSAPTISLAEALGIRPKPTPSPPITRRF